MSAGVEWTQVSSGTLPDDEQTVLVAIDGETDAWPGFIEGGQWFDHSGMPVSVYAWAEMVPTPQAQRT